MEGWICTLKKCSAKDGREGIKFSEDASIDIFFAFFSRLC